MKVLINLVVWTSLDSALTTKKKEVSSVSSLFSIRTDGKCRRSKQEKGVEGEKHSPSRREKRNHSLTAFQFPPPPLRPSLTPSLNTACGGSYVVRSSVVGRPVCKGYVPKPSLWRCCLGAVAAAAQIAARWAVPVREVTRLSAAAGGETQFRQTGSAHRAGTFAFGFRARSARLEARRGVTASCAVCPMLQLILRAALALADTAKAEHWKRRGTLVLVLGGVADPAGGRTTRALRGIRVRCRWGCRGSRRRRRGRWSGAVGAVAAGRTKPRRKHAFGAAAVARLAIQADVWIAARTCRRGGTLGDGARGAGLIGETRARVAALRTRLRLRPVGCAATGAVTCFADQRRHAAAVHRIGGSVADLA